MLGEIDRHILNDIFDELDDAIYIVNPDDSRILHVNQKACNILGYSYEELTSLRVIDIQTSLSSMEKWKRMLFNRLSPGQTYDYIGSHRRKDGTSFPVEIHGKYFVYNGRPCLIGIARDISAWRQIESELLQERNKLEAVLCALGDGLTMQDTNFRILYQNSALQKKQGRHIGEYCYKAYHGRDQVCEGCLLVKVFQHGGSYRRETSVTLEDGSILYMEVSASPVRDSEDRIIAGIETVRDITRSKELESQFLQAQKMEAVGRLTGGIAHDFNNILTIIMGYSEMTMTMAQAGTPLFENLKAINEASNRASLLTRQLLSFSRQQSSSTKNINLLDSLRDMSKMLRQILGKDIDLQLEYPDVEPMIAVDETHFTQIMMNLAVNARDAMAGGGIFTINVKCLEIDETQAEEENLTSGNYVCLKVSDTGCGISQDIMDKIFEPFFTTKAVGRGTGLGLSTVYGLVNNYKGRIVVDSVLGHGTTFTILLSQVDLHGA
ncbi:MAG TPA: PAS domain S-box protein [Desulfobacterales bacterium]|nr:PAS domain S-box protein [Desulfobacterales bacterium]